MVSEHNQGTTISDMFALKFFVFFHSFTALDFVDFIFVLVTVESRSPNPQDYRHANWYYSGILVYWSSRID